VAGNVGTGYFALKYDATDPTVEISLDPVAPDGDNDWYVSDVEVTLTADDATSLVASVDYSLDGGTTWEPYTTPFTISPDGTYAVDARVADNAGNTGSDAAGFKIDQTAPLASASRTPAANSYGWNNSDVTVSFSGTDNLSGITSCDEDVVLGEGSNQSASGTCTDEAGNVSGPASIGGVNVDKTAPQVSCTSVAFVLNQPGAVVSAGVSDALSGAVLAVVSANVGTASVGSFNVNLTGEDKAGNQTTVSCGYTVGYNFAGLAAPVNKPSTMNVSKAGQAIPLKWRITDYNGVGITTLTTVGVTVTGVSCGTGTTTDELEEYASGNSGLQNLGDGNYQFNWKTPTSYANSCKNLSIKLGSAADAPKMENLALFTFKK
jgi:hypothetical protein